MRIRRRKVWRRRRRGVGRFHAVRPEAVQAREHDVGGLDADLGEDLDGGGTWTQGHTVLQDADEEAGVVVRALTVIPAHGHAVHHRHTGGQSLGGREKGALDANDLRGHRPRLGRRGDHVVLAHEHQGRNPDSCEVRRPVGPDRHSAERAGHLIERRFIRIASLYGIADRGRFPIRPAVTIPRHRLSALFRLRTR